MKRKYILGLIAAVGLVSMAATNLQQHECVILEGFNDAVQDSNGYHFSGISVYCSSSSDGAPRYTNASSPRSSDTLKPMAQAIAELLREGYVIKTVSPDQLTVTLVK